MACKMKLSCKNMGPLGAAAAVRDAARPGADAMQLMGAVMYNSQQHKTGLCHKVLWLQPWGGVT